MDVTLELSDPVVMQSKHTLSRIFHKNFGNWNPIAKTLINYNNNLEEIDEDGKKKFILNLMNKKQILIMIKMLSTLNDQMYKMKTRKILLWLTSLRACKSKLMRKIFQKVTE